MDGFESNRQNEFKAFAAIVQSLGSQSYSDGELEFLDTAAKFYKITPERYKAEVRLKSSLRTDADLSNPKSINLRHTITEVNAKARSIADQIKDQLKGTIVSKSPNNDTVETKTVMTIGSIKDTSDVAVENKSAIKPDVVEAPNCDKQKQEQTDVLPVALKILESKCMKERRNYLTLPSGVTVSLQRGNSLTEKLGIEMLKPTPLPQTQIKMKKGLMNELIPPVKSQISLTTSTNESKFGPNMLSAVDAVVNNTISQSKVVVKTGDISHPNNKRVLVEKTASPSPGVSGNPQPQRQNDMPGKAKRARIGSVSNVATSRHPVNSSMGKGVSAVSAKSFNPGSSSAMAGLVYSPSSNATQATRAMPVIRTVADQSGVNNIHTVHSMVDVHRRSPGSLTVMGRSVRPVGDANYLAASYCKYGPADEDEDDDSEPEFDTSRFNTNNNPSSAVPLSSRSSKGQPVNQQKPMATATVVNSQAAPQTQQTPLHNQHHTAMPDHSYPPNSNLRAQNDPSWSGNKEHPMQIPHNSTPVTSTNFDLTSTLVHPTMLHTLHPRSAGSVGLVRGGLGQNELQEVAGRQLVLSKSNTNSRVIHPNNAHAPGSSNNQTEQTQTRATQNYSTIPQSALNEKYPFIRPISASQLAQSGHSNFANANQGLSSNSHPGEQHSFVLNQPKVVQRSLTKSASGTASYTIRQQPTSPSAQVGADSSVQQHSLPLSAGVTVNKIDRQLIGGSSQTAVPVLPLQRKVGPVTNVPKAIIQPTTNQGQPLMRNLDARQAVLPKAVIQPNACHTSGDQNVYRVMGPRDPGTANVSRARTVVTTRPFSSNPSHQSASTPVSHYYVQTNSSSQLNPNSHQEMNQGVPSGGLSTINPVALQQLSVNSSASAHRQPTSSENTRITLVNVAPNSGMITSSSQITAKELNKNLISQQNQMQMREQQAVSNGSSSNATPVSSANPLSSSAINHFNNMNQPFIIVPTSTPRSLSDTTRTSSS